VDSSIGLKLPPPFQLFRFISEVSIFEWRFCLFAFRCVRIGITPPPTAPTYRWAWRRFSHGRFLFPHSPLLSIAFESELSSRKFFFFPLRSLFLLVRRPPPCRSDFYAILASSFYVVRFLFSAVSPLFCRTNFTRCPCGAHTVGLVPFPFLCRGTFSLFIAFFS